MSCGVVIKSKGFESLTAQDVMDHVAKHLPSYKHLHGGVVFVDEFPTTPSGKIIKRLIAEYAEKEIGKENQ